jgi:non-specific serine/threonine protein kinase
MVEAVSQSAADGLHGFAPALTSFVGRADAVSEVSDLLARHRLVTVTGPGGAGKTRLVSEVARRVADRFADGVWLAELGAVREPAQVPGAVAAALGVRELPGVSQADALAQVLAQMQLLLVLDNCEHVIGAAATFCAGLLPAADDLRILTTSRESLRVAGEARYRLALLTLPGPDDAADVSWEAVRLFTERAGQADPRFTLDDETGPVVAQLVRRLDGMPLAIELAAARVESLGARKLLDRLDDRFDLLTTGDRTAAGRQRSLAATVDWSYRLLGSREQQVFRAVSVFPGPFTLEAAEAVAGEDAGPVVLHLVDCSLLVPPRTDPDGRSRYVMLETLRAYGAGLLSESGESATVAAALAGYALDVAEQATTALQTTSGEPAAVRWLDAEEATMRQALAWAMERDTGMALRLAVALAPWWCLRGRAATGSQLLRDAAGQAPPGSAEWCSAGFWLGQMALYSMDLAGALGHFTAVRDAVADRGPSPMLADCLACLSGTLSNLGRTEEAADDGHRALAMARQLGYPAGETLALVTLSITAYYTGDLDDALRLARQAEEVEADVPGWIARSASIIATIVLSAAGKLADAERSCVTGLARAGEPGDLQSRAALLVAMAYLDLQAGRTEDASAHLREALQTAARIARRMDVLNCLDACGYLCAATGRAADAVTVWAAHATFASLVGYTEPPADARRRAESLRDARQALGEDQARAAADRGAAMSMTTAAEYALMLTAAEQAREPAALAQLSGRERELITLVAKGYTDTQIAAELFISARTVSSHLDRIRDKTGCRRRADLTRLALSVGLL